MNKHHAEILNLIIKNSGKGTKHTSLDSYLGNSHPRYEINAPTLRRISKEWMKEHRDMDSKVFSNILTSLIQGESSTEKMMAGILLDDATADQRRFDPALFDEWLNNLEGWAEIDAVCTGKYTIKELPLNIPVWKKLLQKFSKSDNINKRRASLVFLCSPVRHHADPQLADIALSNISRLKKEREIIITRAISWLMRSMIKNYRQEVTQLIKNNASSLPAIAVRETRVKLKTGVKVKRKKL